MSKVDDRDTDRLTLLETARDTLVEAMATSIDCPSCGAVLDGPAANLPSVVRELRATLAEIEALSGPQEASTIDRLRDDLAAKRAVREAAAGS